MNSKAINDNMNESLFLSQNSMSSKKVGFHDNNQSTPFQPPSIQKRESRGILKVPTSISLDNTPNGDIFTP